MTHVLRVKHQNAYPRIAKYRQFICLLEQPVPSTCKSNLEVKTDQEHRYRL